MKYKTLKISRFLMHIVSIIRSKPLVVSCVYSQNTHDTPLTNLDKRYIYYEKRLYYASVIKR